MNCFLWGTCFGIALCMVSGACERWKEIRQNLAAAVENSIVLQRIGEWWDSRHGKWLGYAQERENAEKKYDNMCKNESGGEKSDEEKEAVLCDELLKLKLNEKAYSSSTGEIYALLSLAVAAFSLLFAVLAVTGQTTENPLLIIGIVCFLILMVLIIPMILKNMFNAAVKKRNQVRMKCVKNRLKACENKCNENEK